MSYARLRQTLRRGLRFVPAGLRAPLARLGRRLFPATPAAVPKSAVDDAGYAARVAAESVAGVKGLVSRLRVVAGELPQPETKPIGTQQRG